MWVKICGNTSLEDAALAAELGANAVGFIFARSPRRITPAAAAAISRGLPPHLERVGVFDSGSPREIVAIAAEANLTAVQLHGPFQPETLVEISAAAAPVLAVIQVLHWTVAADAATLNAQLSEDLNRIHELARTDGTQVRVLIDSKVGSAAGGTGVHYDWAAAAPVFRLAGELGLRPIAAGGLRPANVAEAIAQLLPFGVDVSSGVELSPGHKDPAAVAAFLANARGASRS